MRFITHHIHTHTVHTVLHRGTIDSDMQNPLLLSKVTLTCTPNFFFPNLSWSAPFHVCCCMSLALQNLWSAKPRTGSHFFLSLPKGLASSPEIRSAWLTCSEMCTSRSPLANGPTPAVMTVTRSKERKPCSICDCGPPLPLDLNQPVPATKPGSPSCYYLAHLLVQTHLQNWSLKQTVCFEEEHWKIDAKP